MRLTGFLLLLGLFTIPSIKLAQETVTEEQVPVQDNPPPPDTAEIIEKVEEGTPQLVSPEEIGPSLEKAAEEGEKQSSLKELLAVPFEQLKEDTDEGEDMSPPEMQIQEEKDDEGELPEPTEPQQSRSEKILEENLDIHLQELLPQEYVGVTVSIKYFIETVPVTKNKKKITKIKLPGFDNHVWVPTKSKQIVGIVNQSRSYTTVFIVVNTPISPFNIEVLRQSLSDRIEQINMLKDDVLKVVYVPHASSIDVGITTLGRVAKSDDQLASMGTDEDTIPELQTESGELPGMSNEEPERKKKRQLTPEEIDMAMKMETTRYLLKARESYQHDDFDTAITAISEAIEVNPYSPQAYEMLGSIYYRLGWNGMALENWQRALKLDPGNEVLIRYISRLAKR